MALPAILAPHITDDPMLRIQEVEELCGYKRSSIYRMIRAGRFPKARHPGGGTAARWLKSEIIDWRDTDGAPAEAA